MPRGIIKHKYRLLLQRITLGRAVFQEGDAIKIRLTSTAQLYSFINFI